jgi:hypothetical protein
VPWASTPAPGTSDAPKATLCAIPSGVWQRIAKSLPVPPRVAEFDAVSVQAASSVNPDLPSGAWARRSSTRSNGSRVRSPITPSGASSTPARGVPPSANSRDPSGCSPRIAVSSITASTRSASTRSTSEVTGSARSSETGSAPIRNRPLRVGRSRTESARNTASPLADRPLLAPSPIRSTKAACLGTSTSGSTSGPTLRLLACAGATANSAVRRNTANRAGAEVAVGMGGVRLKMRSRSMPAPGRSGNGRRLRILARWLQIDSPVRISS